MTFLLVGIPAEFLGRDIETAIRRYARCANDRFGIFVRCPIAVLVGVFLVRCSSLALIVLDFAFGELEQILVDIACGSIAAFVIAGFLVFNHAMLVIWYFLVISGICNLRFCGHVHPFSPNYRGGNSFRQIQQKRRMSLVKSPSKHPSIQDLSPTKIGTNPDTICAMHDTHTVGY